MVTITPQEWEQLGDMLLYACGLGSFMGCVVWQLAHGFYRWIEFRLMGDSDEVSR